MLLSETELPIFGSRCKMKKISSKLWRLFSSDSAYYYLIDCCHGTRLLQSYSLFYVPVFESQLFNYALLQLFIQKQSLRFTNGAIGTVYERCCYEYKKKNSNKLVATEGSLVLDPEIGGYAFENSINAQKGHQLSCHDAVLCADFAKLRPLSGAEKYEPPGFGKWIFHWLCCLALTVLFLPDLVAV